MGGSFVFLGPYLWLMKVPRLGVESELQLPAYTTGTAMPDPSHIYNLHHSSRQRQILNPLSEARDRTCNLMVPSQIRFCCTMTGTPPPSFLIASPVLNSFHYFQPAEGRCNGEEKANILQSCMRKKMESSNQSPIIN